MAKQSSAERWRAQRGINGYGIQEQVALAQRRVFRGPERLQVLMRAVGMVDLTTLEGMDTAGKVRQLCHRAIRPIPTSTLPDDAKSRHIQTAAVCVYPSMVPVAAAAVAGSPVRVAAVATSFPSGQLPLDLRLEEVRRTVDAGANEIDMVISRGAYFEGRYDAVYEEVKRVKEACGRARLKVILETGELGSFDDVYRASWISMEAGADFIKTSTGKINPAATLPVTLVMLQAIRDFQQERGRQVGMKPAGGIRTADQALTYLALVQEVLGVAWLTPEWFRFGASSLLNGLIREILMLERQLPFAADDFSTE